MENERFYHMVIKAYPAGLRKKVQELLVYSGTPMGLATWLGPALILGYLIFTINYLLPWVLYGEFSWWGAAFGLLGFLFVQVLLFTILYFRAEDRARRVEEVLPDALQLISSNLRAGMAPFGALRVAARPEFGPLEEELKIATTKSLGAESLESALMSIGTRIRSESLNRVLKLFSSSIRSGAKLADLLQEAARDITDTQALKREMATNTKTYSMFILFAVVGGMPFLLALSIHFVKMMEVIRPERLGEAAGAIGFGGGEQLITIAFLTQISYVIIFVTSFLASAMMGVIKEGKESYGARYVPVIMSLSYVLFFVAKVVISGAFVG